MPPPQLLSRLPSLLRSRLSLPSSTWPPPMLTSPPSSVASLLLLPSLPPLLLRRLLESRWPKRETRPVEVQKQQTVSLSDCFLCNQCNKTKKQKKK